MLNHYGTLLRSTVIGAAIVTGGVTAALGDDIKIAIAAPVTGALAAPGAEIVNGAKLAVEDLNAAGGVNGSKISMQTFDDACEPKQAVSVANLVVSEGINYVSGHLCSGSTIPASEVYQDNNITEITVSSNPLVTERKLDWLFRIAGRDDQQGPAGARFILDKFKGQAVALLSDKSSYGVGLVAAARDKLVASGVTPIFDDTINPGEKDYSAVVTKLKALGVKVVYFGGYHTEAGLLLRQSADTGFNLSIVGGDGLNTPELASIAGASAANAYFTFPPDPTRNPAGAAVAKRLEAKNISASGWTLYSYAIIETFAEGIKRAGKDASQVPAALRKSPIKTIVGTVNFDDKGDNNAPGYAIYHFDNGKPVELD